MKTVTAIKRVQALLTNPKKWTKGWYARDRHGEPCDVDEGVAFCVGGAFGTLGFYLGEQQSLEIDGILKQAIPKAFKPRAKHRVATYNDFCTHRRLLQWLDRAIKIAGAK